MEWPPFLKKKEKNAEEAASQEFIPQAKPEALPVATLVSEAMMGDVADFVLQLDAYVDGWHDYATHRNNYSSAEVASLQKARIEAIRIAGELSKSEGKDKEKPEGELRALLEEMAGPLAMNVETATEANVERIKNSQEATKAETRKTLEQSVSLFEQHGPVRAPEDLGDSAISPTPSPAPGNTVLELTSEQIAPKEKSERQQAAEDAVAPEKAAMDAAEAAYLAEYKNFYSTKGAKEGKEPDELLNLQRAYDEARLAYGNSLTNSAEKRLLDKYAAASGSTERALDPRRKEVLERYNRIVRYNEIIKPATEKKYAAKLEGMGEREKGIFSKALYWVGGQNKKMEERFGKNGWRFVRAAAITGAVGLGAGALGAFGTVGIFGALSWGTYRFGRSLASSFAGAGLGEAAARAYGATIGKNRQERAQNELSYIGRSGEALTIDMLEEYDADRMKLEKRADSSTLEKEKMLVRAITAFGVGAGTSAFLSHLPSGLSGATEIANNADQSTGAPVPSASPISTPSVEHAPSMPQTVPTVPESHGVSMVTGATVHQPGEGTDALFRELKANIEGNDLLKSHESPALKHFLETPPNELSREMGAVFGERGIITHQGDQFFVDEHQNVYFQYDGHQPQLFIENKPDGLGNDFTVHHEFDARPLPPVAESQAQAVAPEQVAQPVITPEPVTIPSTPAPAAPEVAPIVSQNAIPAPEPVNVYAPESTPVSAPVQVPEAVISPPSIPEQIASVPIPEHVPEPISPLAPTPVTPPIEATFAHVPESSIDHPSALDSAPTAVQEVITNSHGLQVDPNVAHLYESTSTKGYNVIWGGSNEQKDALINKFYSDPQNETKILVYVSADKSSITGENRVGFYSSAGPQVNSVGRFDQVRPPELNSFTKIVQ